jgi:hypothetical protein
MTWIASCDLKGWETQAALNYFTFGTPTMYLQETNNKILVKPLGPVQTIALLQMLRVR